MKNKLITNTELISIYRNFNFVKFWDAANYVNVAFTCGKFNFIETFLYVLNFLTDNKYLIQNENEKIHFEMKLWNSSTEYLIIETEDLTGKLETSGNGK